MPFLSTLSLRRATDSTVREDNDGTISIHALLAESDYCEVDLDDVRDKFLSTLSLRRATGRCSGR